MAQKFIFAFDPELSNCTAYRIKEFVNFGTSEICALLGYYAASNGNPLPTFRDNVSVPSSRVKKSVNVAKGLPFDAA